MLKFVLLATFVVGLLLEGTLACKAESSCTKPPSCKKNEVWESCPDCNPQTCSTIGQKMTCPDKPCKGACRCIKGYARDNNGDCVPKEYCSRCTKPNEVYDPCPDCSPQTCETMNKVYNCPLIPSDPCDPRCKPACRCKRGYFRNKIGECISAENCAKCSNLHEYWSCGPVCDNRCDSKYGQDNCNVVNVKCNEMCYCEKGFARAANETCIPKEDCEYECPADEVYSECPAAICAPKKCSDAGYPLNCTTINDGDPCPESPCCICKEGYLRDDNGKCILSTNCPSCRGDRNATSACENHCGNTCADYNKENVICTLSCKLNGCSCRKGYVYDSNTKQCVLPCDCTKQCQANEEYSTCANGVCRAQSCSEYGQPPRFCPVFDKTKCIPGCVCKDKCLKNKNGKCIPQDQCPEAKTEAPPCDT